MKRTEKLHLIVHVEVADDDMPVKKSGSRTIVIRMGIDAMLALYSERLRNHTRSIEDFRSDLALYCELSLLKTLGVSKYPLSSEEYTKLAEEEDKPVPKECKPLPPDITIKPVPPRQSDPLL